MYSNDPKQIRNGLTSYIGALLKAVPYEDKAAKQVVVATLLEEAMKLGIDNEKIDVDMYALKPFFRACQTILDKRILEIEELKVSSKSIQEQVAEYKNIISSLKKLIENIK